jgi:hypothetical protein
MSTHQTEWEKRKAELDKKLAELKARNAAARDERTTKMNAGTPLRTTPILTTQSIPAPAPRRERPSPAPIPPRTVAPSGAHEYNRRDFGKY